MTALLRWGKYQENDERTKMRKQTLICCVR